MSDNVTTDHFAYLQETMGVTSHEARTPRMSEPYGDVLVGEHDPR